MKVLMFGWEFPPFKSGGLGTACYGLTKSLSKLKVEVIFVIPNAPFEIKSDFLNLVIGNQVIKNFKKVYVDAFLSPYLNSKTYEEQINNSPESSRENYGSNLFSEVERYGEMGKILAKDYEHDVIHAHDWLSAKAGINAKKISGKKFIFQVHATEFDRTGGNPNPFIYNIEKQAMNEADKVVTVSNYTKSIIVKKYFIPEEKIEVIHNGLDMEDENLTLNFDDENKKTVLFLGRITIQKGPEYFLEAAKKVLEIQSNVRFIIAGDGDMLHFCIEKAASLGISKNVLFSGFLRGKEVDKVYQMADVYVMPSVSEPFGIAPLEAMKNGVPVIISKSSGVSEVIQNCFRVDFWDIDEMANKILALINYKTLHRTMKHQAFVEVQNMSWDLPATKFKKLYSEMDS